MKRTSLKGNACPVARALDAIGDWWSLLIIRDASTDSAIWRFQRSWASPEHSDRASAQARGQTGYLHLRRPSTARVSGVCPHREGPGSLSCDRRAAAVGEAYFFARRSVTSSLLDRVRTAPFAGYRCFQPMARALAPADTFVRKVRQ